MKRKYHKNRAVENMWSKKPHLTQLLTIPTIHPLVLISSRYKELQEKNEATKALIRKRDEANRIK